MKKRLVILMVITICLGVFFIIKESKQNEGMQFFDTEDLNLYHTDLEKEFIFLTEKLELSTTLYIKDLSLSYDHTGDIKTLYILLSTNDNNSIQDYEVYYEDGNRYGVRTSTYNTVNNIGDRINKADIMSFLDYLGSTQYGPEDGYIYKISYEGQMTVADTSNCFIYNTNNQSLVKADQNGSNQTFKLSKQKIVSEQEVESESYEIYFLE